MSSTLDRNTAVAARHGRSLSSEIANDLSRRRQPLLPDKVHGTSTRHDAADVPLQPLVAVIDDDESVRESLPDLLRAFGFSARAFPSAEDFLDSDCIHLADCLILDISMPGMTGPELQKELASRRDIPVVFITAHASATMRKLVMNAGAVACLLKPFSESSLLTALNKALARDA